MTDYVGRHRMPDNEDDETTRLHKIRNLFTRPGYPPVEDHHLFTHPNNSMHQGDRP